MLWISITLCIENPRLRIEMKRGVNLVNKNKNSYVQLKHYFILINLCIIPILYTRYHVRTNVHCSFSSDLIITKLCLKYVKENWLFILKCIQRGGDRAVGGVGFIDPPNAARPCRPTDKYSRLRATVNLPPIKCYYY